MSLEFLPFEIITLIVDEFCNERESLKTLSLVSRAFLYACRKRLFTILRINSLNPLFSYKCGVWDRFLRHSSTLFPCIKILELGPPVFRLRSLDPALCSKHWTAVLSRGLPSIHDERIQFIMTGANNVQIATIRFEFQSWWTLSRSFQQTITDFLKRESLSSLSIEDVVDFPLSHLSHCRRLRDLSLISVHQRNAEGFPTTLIHGHKGYLESLTVFASDDCIDMLVRILSNPSSSLDLSKLQRLSVNATGTDGPNALKMIPCFALSITTLEIRLSSEKGYDLCDLKKFPNLRILFISTSCDRWFRPILSLSRFLSKSHNQTHLEELKVLFRQEGTIISSHELARICRSGDWRVLEQKIAFRNQFPALRKMSLIFRPKDVSTLMSEYLVLSLHQYLMKAMPTLYSMTNPVIEVYDDRFEQYTED